jgi:hypothetical protein
MVTLWNEDSIGESSALASELSAGLRVDLYPEADKWASNLSMLRLGGFLSSRSSVTMNARG